MRRFISLFQSKLAKASLINLIASAIVSLSLIIAHFTICIFWQHMLKYPISAIVATLMGQATALVTAAIIRAAVKQSAEIKYGNSNGSGKVNS